MPEPRATAFPIRSRVLVIGGAGYIGSVLARRLLADGYHVTVLDALFYGAQSLAGLERERWFDVIVGDTRDPAVVDGAVAGADAVVHLGELVGDPACAVDPGVTRDINVEATRHILRRSRELGVRRLIYPSSCSVYGATDEVVDEESELNPVSLYAEAKVLAEEAVGMAATDGLETVTLRLATVYGLSPRPRFDLVVNLFAARGAADRRIEIHGGGQWRPFIHVSDVADAIAMSLAADASAVAGRTFNVGADDQNRTIGQVAVVMQQVPEAELHVQPIDDHRNYRVSFERIRQELAFRPSRTINDGIAEIRWAVDMGLIGDYRDARYSNVDSVRLGLPAAPARIAAVPIESGQKALQDVEPQYVA